MRVSYLHNGRPCSVEGSQAACVETLTRLESKGDTIQVTNADHARNGLLTNGPSNDRLVGVSRYERVGGEKALETLRLWDELEHAGGGQLSDEPHEPATKPNSYAGAAAFNGGTVQALPVLNVFDPESEADVPGRSRRVTPLASPSVFD